MGTAGMMTNNFNHQDREWTGMMGQGRGAALAGWSGGAVGARSKPAPLCSRRIANLGEKAGLRFGPHRLTTPPSRRRAPTTPRDYRFWLVTFIIAPLHTIRIADPGHQCSLYALRSQGEYL